MDTFQQLRNVIETLTPDNLQDQKPVMLSIFDTIYHPNGNGNGNGKHERLSPREREVMNRILGGQRLKEIAAHLDISVKTVTTHRSRLLRKLGVEDNLGLYRYGIRHGMIGV